MMLKRKQFRPSKSIDIKRTVLSQKFTDGLARELQLPEEESHDVKVSDIDTINHDLDIVTNQSLFKPRERSTSQAGNFMQIQEEKIATRASSSQGFQAGSRG